MGASGVNFILYFSSVDTLCFQAICGLGKISVCETNLDKTGLDRTKRLSSVGD